MIAKLDWLANWQNAVSFLAAIATAVWLGPFEAAHFLFVFVIAFAVARVVTLVAQAVWKQFVPGGPKPG